MLEYQGFYASVEYDEAQEQYVGFVSDHPITFEASPGGVHLALITAIEDYVAFCDRRGIQIRRWDRLRKVS